MKHLRCYGIDVFDLFMIYSYRCQGGSNVAYFKKPLNALEFLLVKPQEALDGAVEIVSCGQFFPM